MNTITKVLSLALLALSLPACSNPSTSGSQTASEVGLPPVRNEHGMYNSYFDWCRATDLSDSEMTTIDRMNAAAVRDYGARSSRGCTDFARALDENAEFFGFDSSAVTNIAPLASLKNLKAVALTRNGITDLRPLKFSPKLDWFSFASNIPASETNLECPIADRPGAICEMENPSN